MAPMPSPMVELCSFLGISGHYRHFSLSFATISAPLHATTTIKAKFNCMQEMKSSFKISNDAMSSPLVLAFPEFGKAFMVENDASALLLAQC